MSILSVMVNRPKYLDDHQCKYHACKYHACVSCMCNMHVCVCRVIYINMGDLTTDIWYRQGREGNVLFNDTLNTFYLQLYGIRYMVKNPSDSERGNPLLLFPISSKDSFICIIPQTGYHISWPLLHQSWSTGWNEK